MKHSQHLEPVIEQYLNGKAGPLNDMNIPVTDAMRERLEAFANEFDTDVNNVAGFLLWSFLIDIEGRANAVANNIMPKN